MKLTYQKQVRIVKRKKSGLSSSYIAKQFGLSTRRIQQVWQHYVANGDYIPLKIPGRHKYRKEIVGLNDKILALQTKYRWGASYIAKYLRDKDGLAIGNCYVHELLLRNNLATTNQKKQKRRAPWVRYEREHSLSLVHLDWHFNSSLNKWVCSVLDDASRNILSGGEYDQALQEHSIAMLEESYEKFKHIKPIEQVLTDHGAQFFANKQNEENDATSGFQDYCIKKGIKHILCRYKHPQTNGKYEKWNHTYELNRKYFSSFGEFRIWYNNRPHGSLNFMTPEQAFYVKLQDVILGGFLKWAEKI
jgi:putative transposase